MELVRKNFIEENIKKIQNFNNESEDEKTN